MDLESKSISPTSSNSKAEVKTDNIISNDNFMIIPDDHVERRKGQKLRKTEDKKKQEHTLLPHRLSGDSLSDAVPPSSSSTYQDHASVKPKDFYDESLMLASEAPFTVKLHRILSNPSYSHIISWLPHGRSWRVLQPKVFAQQIIPLHFRHNRISSFMRQVNGWGFRRISQGVDVNSYYHEYFLRGSPHLCLKMRRLGKNETAKSSEGSNDHDFYKIRASPPCTNAIGSIGSKGLLASTARLHPLNQNNHQSDHINVLGQSNPGGLAGAVTVAPLASLALSPSHLSEDLVALHSLQFQQHIFQQRLHQMGQVQLQSRPNSLLLPMTEANSQSLLQEAFIRTQMENQVLRHANLTSNNGLGQSNVAAAASSHSSQALSPRNAFLSDLYRSS